jgi:hypothetical protein
VESVLSDPFSQRQFLGGLKLYDVVDKNDAYIYQILTHELPIEDIHISIYKSSGKMHLQLLSEKRHQTQKTYEYPTPSSNKSSSTLSQLKQVVFQADTGEAIIKKDDGSEAYVVPLDHTIRFTESYSNKAIYSLALPADVTSSEVSRITAKMTTGPRYSMMTMVGESSTNSGDKMLEITIPKKSHGHSGTTLEGVAAVLGKQINIPIQAA